MIVRDVRYVFKDLYKNLSGERPTLEWVGASFRADEDTIFGRFNSEWFGRERRWYDSESLYVNDIEGTVPSNWKRVAGADGRINSNYGYLLFSPENGNQYENARIELTRNPESRRAVCIYTRPEMWNDYCRDGMDDFVCTNVVQYVLRNGKLIAVVQMRSNDVVFGFKNDFAWQKYVCDMMVADLGVEFGCILWQVGSLHIYKRHWWLVDGWIKTGNHALTREEYDALD